MKSAQLHTGEQLDFGDNVPDHAIDAAVRAHLGVPADPDPNVVQMQQMMGQFARLAMTLHQAVTAMAQGQQALMERIDGLGHAIVSASQRSEPAGESAEAAAMRDLATAVGAAADKVVRAVTAPKKLTLDKNGKPTGVTTEGED